MNDASDGSSVGLFVITKGMVSACLVIVSPGNARGPLYLGLEVEN